MPQLRVGPVWSGTGLVGTAIDEKKSKTTLSGDFVLALGR
jgi:hypothetical protein